ncbi:MAG TPA: FixH family protein [Syntrophales bacterium]|nr:FixH family protein [Syntrophales bacterium]
MIPVRQSSDHIPWKLVCLAALCVLLILCFLTGTSDAASLADSKRAGDYVVAIQIDRNPPILGINNIEVEIKGTDGQAIIDAKVLVNYYMPPMPRMAPMNYRVEAPFKGGSYRAAMHFIMEGPWYIVVKIDHRGRAASARFNVNVP